jgi:TrmH family RNA methyltransferase
MMNFDFNKLYLVNPCELDEECYIRSVHAHVILDHAKIFSSFEDAVKNMDYLIATSSIESKTDKKYLRNSVLLDELSEKIYEIDGKIGIVFGREDYGLFNEEIAACDIMIRIPTSESYPSLNLSHSVGLVLYSLYVKKNLQQNKKRIIGNIEKKKLFEFFSELLDEIDYPEHKKEKTKIMFRRLMGRSIPSKWEYHTLMGVLNNTLEKLKKTKM